TPDLALAASYCYDVEGIYLFTGGAAGGYGIIPREQINPKYLLGLLNSRLLDWFLHQISTTFRGGYFSYESRFIKQLPIRLIDFSNPAEKKLHDDLVALVDVMLTLHQRLQKAVGAEREQLQRQIEKTDREIDWLVYKLYGMTEKEQMIVETKS
ncbi:MAG: restriction endonuclease subunit M, partial [candidate division NC10 bacterium]|nr:restriction endonuclease subunit M [candidate division NC10 bacterium]